MWTALPRGADSLWLYLDVFVSPRLGINAADTSYVLSDFPDFEHWPTTVTDHLAFTVELDGTRDAAEVMPAKLDPAAWDHLFRPSTFVRPWKFRDLSGVPIHSYPIRFVTAYLTSLYQKVGRAHPTDPPTPEDLEALVDALGPLIDMRVKAEREPPPRVAVDIPAPHPPPEPEPRKGCLSVLCRVLRPVCRFLRRPYRLLRSWLPVPSFWTRPRPPAPESKTPRIKAPRTEHPSPYGVKPPIPVAHLPKLEELERQMTANKVIAPSTPVGSIDEALAARDITADFARFKLFYKLPESPIRDSTRPAVPHLDFHQALGALGDYPALLRSLGIVIALRVPRPASDPDRVRVIPLWDDGQTRASDVSPVTHTITSEDGFAAAVRPDSHLVEGGMLDLRGATDRPTTDRPKFDVVQVDTDGSAFKVMNLVATLLRSNQLDELGMLGVEPSELVEALAALRSGGLAIVRPDRAYYLRERLLRASTLSVPRPSTVPDEPATSSTDLFADDVLRGYRVEVSTDGGSWRSLCSRIGTYRLVDDAGATVRTLPVMSDEGYVKSTSGTRQAGVDNLYVHEAVVRWTGWSLTAPRPGRTLENHLEEPPPEGEAYDRPQLPQSTAVTEFRLVTSFVPQPGTLPRLRFGHRYRLRVLGVDLAGEPIATPAADSVASDPVTFRRFEPACPPAVLPLRPFLPGESLEHVVLRSDFDKPNAEYDETDWGASVEDAVAQRTRHLFSPKTSQRMAELHGLFDLAFGATGNPNAGYQLALRESGTLADPKVIDVRTVEVDDPQPTIEAGEPLIITPEDGDARGYGINRSNTTLPTPYLPDPLAVGIALRGLPGLVDTVADDSGSLTIVDVPVDTASGETEPLLLIPFTGVWPDLEPLRIRVAEPEMRAAPKPPPHWDAAQRLLTIYLQKAASVAVSYSCYVGPEGLDIHGIWDWLDGGTTADRLRELAENGAHWMISPSRALTLVHAVQRPLLPAHFVAGTMTATKTNHGDTAADLAGTLALHVASTGRIDILGRWQDWLVDHHGVQQVEREAVACDLTVDAHWPDTGPFPPSPRGADLRARHEFGDTRHRRVRYLIKATSRFREYMKPDLDPELFSRETDEADITGEVSVLSSARPESPPVLYAVPTFGWSNPPEFGWQSHEVTRRGGSIRVYLEPSWFSSGEGELLGVVLQAKEPNTLPEKWLTRYGADATWGGATSQSHDVRSLTPGDFLNSVTTESGLSLPDERDLTATVVAFKPEYDTTRHLLYADIALNLEDLPWNYWPFIRMAFVRYQPDSLPRRGPRRPGDVPDVKLSEVVPGEFGQLAPDRTLSLIWEGSRRVKAMLQGRGPSHPSPTHVAFRVQTTQVPPGIPADELDWETHPDGHPVDVDWETFASLVAPHAAVGDRRVWETTVELPHPRGSTRMRLEVAEYEIVRSDSAFGPVITRMTYAAHVDLG